MTTFPYEMSHSSTGVEAAQFGLGKILWMFTWPAL